MSSKSENRNDAGKPARLAVVEAVLKEHLNCESFEIEPIAYEDDFPWDYNNFIYKVSIQGVIESCQPFKQVGTSPIPTDKKSFVIRLPNMASGFNNANRVENEVAALTLARQALGDQFSSLIPVVYAWKSARNEQGWILEEFLPGSNLHDDFDGLEPHDKRTILDQMAAILAALQDYQLPPSVKAFGGLSIDPQSQVISAPMPFMHAGPFETYEDFVRATINAKLKVADDNKIIRGWRDNGVRARIDRFMTEGLHKVLAEAFGDEIVPKRLVHADFSTDNLLYDKNTKCITGLIDFDFAHVGTFADEFFRSFNREWGHFAAPRGTSESAPLYKAMLEGFPEELPADSKTIHWSVAKDWNDALQKHNARSPATIKGINAVADLFWFSGEIATFLLVQDHIVKQAEEETLAKWRARSEAALIQFIDDYGF